jgi:hypothetical protein
MPAMRVPRNYLRKQRNEEREREREKERGEKMEKTTVSVDLVNEKYIARRNLRQ